MNLFKASTQWSTRPDDERFGTLQELHDAVSGYRNTAATATVPGSSLRVQTDVGWVKWSW